MKKTIAYALLMFTLVLAFACGTKKETTTDDKDATEAEATATKEEWKGMDEFHSLMAASFHPYKDNGDLAPAKAKASELAAAAENWHNAPLPARIDNEEVKSKLVALRDGCKAFAETVKTADDKTIADALTKLHDQFHSLQEAWYDGHGEHKHHE